MDITTVLGLLVGFTAVFGGQMLEGGHIGALLQSTAAIIVLGGTIGATLVSYPRRNVMKALRDVAKAFREPKDDPETVIRQLIAFSNKARKNGLITLEEDIKNLSDQFLKQGVEMMVDGLEAEEIQDILQIELSNFEEHNKNSAEIFEAAGGYSPTIGIIGAVLGLIHVMSHLSDTASLGEGIAVAFVATIYGLITANIVCIPFSTKIKTRLKEQILIKEIVIEGVAAILKGENPRLTENRLRGFTLNKEIASYNEKKPRP